MPFLSRARTRSSNALQQQRQESPVSPSGLKASSGDNAGKSAATAVPNAFSPSPTDKPLPEVPPSDSRFKNEIDDGYLADRGPFPPQSLAPPPLAPEHPPRSSSRSDSARGRASESLIRRVSSLFRSSKPPKAAKPLKGDWSAPQARSTSKHPPSAFAAFRHKSGAILGGARGRGTTTSTRSKAGIANYRVPDASSAWGGARSSEESYNESLDDIRRPSGLGSARGPGSFSSHRSLPLTPTSPQGTFPTYVYRDQQLERRADREEEQEEQEARVAPIGTRPGGGDDDEGLVGERSLEGFTGAGGLSGPGVYGIRDGAASAPNLMMSVKRSLSWKGRKSAPLRSKRYSTTQRRPVQPQQQRQQQQQPLLGQFPNGVTPPPPPLGSLQTTPSSTDLHHDSLRTPSPTQVEPAAALDARTADSDSRTSTKTGRSKGLPKKAGAKAAGGGYGMTVSAAPPPSAFAGYLFNSEDRGGASEEPYDESVEDLRRPSGLGSATSHTSHRSTPGVLSHLTTSLPLPQQQEQKQQFPTTEDAENGEKQAVAQEAGLPGDRDRAASTPGLIRSLSLKAKNKLRSKRYSTASQSKSPVKAVASALPPSPLLSPHVLPSLVLSLPAPANHKQRRPASSQLPVEVLEVILTHIPRGMAAILARVSKLFAAAARARLYARLDLCSLPDAQVEKLLGVLVSRWDLTELIQDFSCTRWPAFFNAGRYSGGGPGGNGAAASLSPSREKFELRNTLLTATLTLAISRMSNLTHMTLPSFDYSLLSQHSAFGLSSLTLLHSSMTPEEMVSLLSWLDGQVNIATLRLPNLEDHTGTNSSVPGGAISCMLDGRHSRTETPTYFLHSPVPSVASQPNSTTFSHSNPYLKVSPHASPASASASLALPFNPPNTNDNASSTNCAGAAPSPRFSSSTLLPMVTTLHLTPLFLEYIVPADGGGGGGGERVGGLAVSGGPRAATVPGLGRPSLHTVCLNINTNLYDGLRPSATVAHLKGIQRLTLRFSGNVDHRTVDKVLGAVSLVLGGSADGVPVVGVDEQPTQAKLSCGGLRSLEVAFMDGVRVPRKMEESVYRTLQGTLPRYTQLESMTLNIPPRDSLESPPANFKSLSPINVFVANAALSSENTPTIVEPMSAHGDDNDVEHPPPPSPSIVRRCPSIIESVAKPPPSPTQAGRMNYAFKFPASPNTIHSLIASPAESIPFPVSHTTTTPPPTGTPFPISSVGEATANRTSSSPDLSPISPVLLHPASGGWHHHHLPASAPPSPASTSGGMAASLSLEDDARVEVWFSQCPSLKTVALAGTTWQRSA